MLLVSSQRREENRRNAHRSSTVIRDRPSRWDGSLIWCINWDPHRSQSGFGRSCTDREWLSCSIQESRFLVCQNWFTLSCQVWSSFYFLSLSLLLFFVPQVFFFISFSFLFIWEITDFHRSVSDIYLFFVSFFFKWFYHHHNVDRYKTLDMWKMQIFWDWSFSSLL